MWPLVLLFWEVFLLASNTNFAGGGDDKRRLSEDKVEEVKRSFSDKFVKSPEMNRVRGRTGSLAAVAESDVNIELKEVGDSNEEKLKESKIKESVKSDEERPKGSRQQGGTIKMIDLKKPSRKLTSDSDEAPLTRRQKKGRSMPAWGRNKPRPNITSMRAAEDPASAPLPHRKLDLSAIPAKPATVFNKRTPPPSNPGSDEEKQSVGLEASKRRAVRSPSPPRKKGSTRNNTSPRDQEDLQRSAKRRPQATLPESKKEKRVKDPELAGLSLTLNFVRPEDEDQNSDEDSEKTGLLKKDKKSSDTEMFYNDQVSKDGLISRKTIKITGLSGQGKGTFNEQPAVFGSPAFDNDPRMAHVPSAVFVPNANRRRPHKAPSEMGVGAQLAQASNLIGALNANNIDVAQKEAFVRPQEAPSSIQRRRRRPRQQPQQDSVMNDGVFYVNVNGQMVAFPMTHPELDDDDGTPDLNGPDELESHYLVQVFARTGKQRVMAVNLIRLWRILACLIINIGMFFALNFGAINKINVVQSNSTGAPPPSNGTI